MNPLTFQHGRTVSAGANTIYRVKDKLTKIFLCISRVVDRRFVFVEREFEAEPVRFTSKRKDGARRLRGSGKPAAGWLWSVRDLPVEIG